jgi:hypothetical protein
LKAPYNHVNGIREYFSDVIDTKFDALLNINARQICDEIVDLQIALQKRLREANVGIQCELYKEKLKPEYLKSITWKNNDFSFTFPSVYDQSILSFEFIWLRDREIDFMDYILSFLKRLGGLGKKAIESVGGSSGKQITTSTAALLKDGGRHIRVEEDESDNNEVEESDNNDEYYFLSEENDNRDSNQLLGDSDFEEGESGEGDSSSNDYSFEEGESAEQTNNLLDGRQLAALAQKFKGNITQSYVAGSSEDEGDSSSNDISDNESMKKKQSAKSAASSNKLNKEPPRIYKSNQSNQKYKSNITQSDVAGSSEDEGDSSSNDNSDYESMKKMQSAKSAASSNKSNKEPPRIYKRNNHEKNDKVNAGSSEDEGDSSSNDNSDNESESKNKSSKSAAVVASSNASKKQLYFSDVSNRTQFTASFTFGAFSLVVAQLKVDLQTKLFTEEMVQTAQENTNVMISGVEFARTMNIIQAYVHHRYLQFVIKMQQKNTEQRKAVSKKMSKKEFSPPKFKQELLAQFIKEAEDKKMQIKDMQAACSTPIVSKHFPKDFKRNSMQTVKLAVHKVGFSIIDGILTKQRKESKESASLLKKIARFSENDEQRLATYKKMFTEDTFSLLTSLYHRSRKERSNFDENDSFTEEDAVIASQIILNKLDAEFFPKAGIPYDIRKKPPVNYGAASTPEKRKGKQNRAIPIPTTSISSATVPVPKVPVPVPPVPVPPVPVPPVPVPTTEINPTSTAASKPSEEESSLINPTSTAASPVPEVTPPPVETSSKPSEEESSVINPTSSLGLLLVTTGGGVNSGTGDAAIEESSVLNSISTAASPVIPPPVVTNSKSTQDKSSSNISTDATEEDSDWLNALRIHDNPILLCNKPAVQLMIYQKNEAEKLRTQSLLMKRKPSGSENTNSKSSNSAELALSVKELAQSFSMEQSSPEDFLLSMYQKLSFLMPQLSQHPSSDLPTVPAANDFSFLSTPTVMTSTNFRQHPTEEDLDVRQHPTEEIYDVEQYLQKHPKKKRRKLTPEERAYLDRFLFED